MGHRWRLDPRAICRDKHRYYAQADGPQLFLSGISCSQDTEGLVVPRHTILVSGKGRCTANYACNIGDTVDSYCAFRLNFGMPSFFPHPQTLPLRSGIMISHTKEMIQAMTVSTTMLFL